MIVLFKKEDLQEPSRGVNLGIPVMEKLEILKVVADMAEKESGRTWTRYAMMLYASIGLLGILLLTLKIGMFWVSAVPALIGTAVAVAWLKTNSFWGSYAQGWQTDMEKLVKSDPTLYEWVKATNLPDIRRFFESRKSRLYFNLLPNAFLGVWFFVFLAVMVSVLWRGPQKMEVADTAGESQAYVGRGVDRTGKEVLSEPAVVEAPEEGTGEPADEGAAPASQVIAVDKPGASSPSGPGKKSEAVKTPGSGKKTEPSRQRLAPPEVPF